MNIPSDQDHRGNPRLFPPISDFIIKRANEAGASVSKAAERLQNLTNQRPMGLRAWYGWGLAPRDRLAHLLTLYRWAVAAEADGYWQRADFYWREIYEVLRRDWRKGDFWQVAAQIYSDEVGLERPLSGEEFRDQIVKELIVDTFCGLYNGRAQRGELGTEDRAFRYIEGVEKLLVLTNSSETERASLLSGPYRLRIQLLHKEKRWTEAIRACEHALNNLTESVEYQNALANTVLQHAFAELSSGDSNTQNEVDAGILKQRIQQVEQARRRYPGNAFFYEVLGILYHALAVKLGNAQLFSQALVAAQKALTFSPELEQAYKTRASLVDALHRLQEQMKSTLEQISRTPNAALKAEGLRLQREAQQGNKPLKAFHESEEAKAIVQGLRKAHAATLWLNIGLPKPEGDPMVAALALFNALQAVAEAAPSTTEHLRQSWEEQQRATPMLSAVNSDLVIDFLEQRLLHQINGSDQTGEAGSPDANDQTHGDRKPRQPKSSNGSIDEKEKGQHQQDRNPESDAEESYIASRASMDPPPVIHSALERAKSDAEPFAHWLLSRQSPRLKLQCAVAVILLLVAGGLWVGEMWAQAARNRAYQEAVAAIADNNLDRAIGASETFFSRTTWANDGEREMGMRDIYSKALVQWIAQLDGELRPEDKERVARFESLVPK